MLWNADESFLIRYLLFQAHIGQMKLKLLNTHLESTGEFAEERMNQMLHCFEEIQKAGDSINVIFGGDLNCRDKEVGTRTRNIVDIAYKLFVLRSWPKLEAFLLAQQTVGSRPELGRNASTLGIR